LDPAQQSEDQKKGFFFRGSSNCLKILVIIGSNRFDSVFNQLAAQIDELSHDEEGDDDQVLPHN